MSIVGIGAIILSKIERGAAADKVADTGKPPSEAIAIGSGFLISPDGYAVTNSRIVEGGNTLEIRTSDDKVYPARLVGNDLLSGLALIKVDGRSDFSYVKLADQPPRVGDWILTVGNPFGLKGTVTAGIVSHANAKSQWVPPRDSSRSMHLSIAAIPADQASTPRAMSSASTA